MFPAPAVVLHVASLVDPVLMENLKTQTVGGTGLGRW